MLHFGLGLSRCKMLAIKCFFSKNELFIAGGCESVSKELDLDECSATSRQKKGRNFKGIIYRRVTEWRRLWMYDCLDGIVWGGGAEGPGGLPNLT